MREILFRGQHRRYGEQVNMAEEKLPSVWVYGGVLQGEGDFSIIYGSKSPDGKFEEKYSVYTETLGQYTGLTDKNGKKIFEGDIVLRHDKKAEVRYQPSEFVLVFPDNPYPQCGLLTTSCLNENKEVIGNIYDNPELLKEAT